MKKKSKMLAKVGMFEKASMMTYCLISLLIFLQYM